ncbi:uncharacterized protein LOC129290974 [Prosopis cineraria]|uniref:uncharacterized protein LOC129290974 n=1 Tax=Prosopis cineraria TaxID=364024 RepID=UPI00240FD204|nr:uncharacterized protein LOC129290974 [Prosopis cineraria]
MKKLDQVAPDIRDYLLDVGYEKWSRCYSMRSRYDIMTSNISKSMNSTLDDARDLLIIPLIEFIRNKLQDWFYTRRMHANSISSHLTPWAKKQLSEQIELCRHMEVQPNDVNEFTVVHGKSSFIIYLETRSCSCRKWDFEEIPCSHACAVISKQRLYAYTFISRYYTNYYFSTISSFWYILLLSDLESEPCMLVSGSSLSISSTLRGDTVDVPTTA